jgi:hypothetical protein
MPPRAFPQWGGSAAGTTLPYGSLTASTSAPTVRGGVAQTGSSVSSLTYAYPTGTKAGDLIIGFQNGSGFTPASCTPAPWAQIDTQVPSGGHDWLFSHIVGDEGPLGAPSAVVVGSAIFAGTLVWLSATPAGVIVLDQELGATFADAASVTTGTITTTRPNEICLCFAEHAGSAGLLSMTGPSGITMVSQHGSQSVYQFPKAAAGATTAVVITDAAGTSTKGWAVFLVSFMPTGN